MRPDLIRVFLLALVLSVGCGQESDTDAVYSPRSRASEGKVSKTATPLTDLELARLAARAFCRRFDFPSDKIREIKGPPLTDPGLLRGPDPEITSYQWLGPGSGDAYVRVDINTRTGAVVVYGGYAHREFGPWDHRVQPQ